MKKEGTASSSSPSSCHVTGKSKSQKKRKYQEDDEDNGVSSQQSQLQPLQTASQNGGSSGTPTGSNSVAALMADVRDNMPTYRLPPFHSTLSTYSLFSPLASSSASPSSLTSASSLLSYNPATDFASTLHHPSTHHPGHPTHPNGTPHQSQLVGIFSSDYLSSLQHQFATGSSHLLGSSTGHFPQQQPSLLQPTQQLQSPPQQVHPHGDSQQQLFRGLSSPVPNRLFASQGVHAHYSPSLPSFGNTTSYTNLLSGYQPSDSGVVIGFQIDSSSATTPYLSNWYNGQSARPTL